MKLTKKAKIALAAGFLLLSAIGGGYWYYRHTHKEAYDYTDYYVLPESKDLSSDTEKKEEAPQKELSLELLKKTNPDVIGILEFDDRVIYEPVVQAPDNDYYVRKNIEQRYSAAGIPFVTGDGNIYSTNVVIYGHSSVYDNIIFTPLMSYVSKDYYLDHPAFRLQLEDVTRTYQIFAVLNVDTKDPYDTLEFANSEWRKASSYEEFLQDMKSRSLYDTGVSVSAADKIITLVTCDTRDGNKRIVVLGKEVSIEYLNHGHTKSDV